MQIKGYFYDALVIAIANPSVIRAFIFASGFQAGPDVEISVGFRIPYTVRRA